MDSKKGPYPKEVWTKLLPDVVAILKKGPKQRGALIEEAKGKGYRDKTVDRMLKSLKDAALIEKREDGRYEWIKEYQEYKTMDEYQAKLQHAKDLLGSGIDSMRIDNHKLTIVSPIYGKDSMYFLQHLNTGYQDVYKLYNDWTEDKSEVNKVKEAFYEEIEKIFSQKGFEIKEHPKDLKEGERHVSSGVFHSIKLYCKFKVEGKLKERAELRLRDEWVFDPAINERIAINKNIIEDLEELIGICIHSERVENLYKTLKNIEDKEIEDRSNFIKKIIKIIDEVRLGKPLEGSCEACTFMIRK